MLNRSIHCIFIASLSLTLGSCGGSTQTKPSNPAPIVNSAAASSDASMQTFTSPKDIVAQAQAQKSPQRETLLLQAAGLYIEQNKVDKARGLINDINPSQLTDQNLPKYSQLSATIQLKDGQVDNARRILTNTHLEQQLKTLEPAQEGAIRELRAQAFERSGQLQESIAERISLSALLTSREATNTNQEALWQSLMSLPLSDLEDKATTTSGSITQGWYALASLSKNNVQDLESQQAALSKWLAQWHSHPAANNLPKDLRLLQTLTNQQPKKIALLLPMQGRLAEAGEAVRDGFLAAYYQQQHTHHTLPNVRQYDTSKGAVAALQLAINEGADLIIGPLDREDVNQITHLNNLPVPVLSLNYPDQQPTQPIANFYQFGLAVEDEARQAARQAIAEGHKRAVIVTGTQEANERSAQAFISEWKKLGGAVIGRSTFSTQEKFSESIRNLMLLDESQSRATLLQQQLGTKFEFTPRRRDDVDIIFMAVSPGQGRQVKPTLAFYYANNISTYATSSIYSGDVDAINNEDLNGVLFNTLPWIFDNTSPEKQAIAQNTKSAAVYGRLHALGVDAFHLYSRLPLLKEAPQMRVYGSTGSLHLLADGRIEREQMWARFNAGLAEPMATVIDNNNDETSE